MSVKTIALASLVTLIGITDVYAVRQRQRTVDNTPAPAPICRVGEQWVDCVTNEPVPAPTTDEPAPQTESNVNSTVVSEGEATREGRTDIRRGPPLDLRYMTIEEFNDSRVAGLNNQVRTLINEAVSVARRPFRPGRNDSLVAEIQVRLDPLADGTNPNRPIDYYWMIFFQDRTVVFVKPMRNLHILRYNIEVSQ